MSLVNLISLVRSRANKGRIQQSSTTSNRIQEPWLSCSPESVMMSLIYRQSPSCCTTFYNLSLALFNFFEALSILRHTLGIIHTFLFLISTSLSLLKICNASIILRISESSLRKRQSSPCSGCARETWLNCLSVQHHIFSFDAHPRVLHLAFL